MDFETKCQSEVNIVKVCLDFELLYHKRVTQDFSNMTKYMQHIDPVKNINSNILESKSTLYY